MFQLPAQFLSEIVGWLRRLEQPGGSREKRRSTRVIVCARVTAMDPKSRREFTAMTRDFSAGGLGLMQSVAAAKGEAGVAEAALELTPEVAQEFLEWFFDK